MKRLIVLTAVATLLASLSGCSILANRGAQSCDTTSPAPSLLQRVRLPRVTLPWRSKVAPAGDCVSCNAEVAGQEYIGGQIVEGSIVNGSSIPSSNLYDPNTVYGTSYGSTSIQTTPLEEVVPAPAAFQ